MHTLKKEFPEICLMTDVAMDPYSSDGHDGYVDEKGNILNDVTLPILSRMAVAQAQAGADIIGPSDMMDGRVAAIRQALDEADFSGLCLLWPFSRCTRLGPQSRGQENLSDESCQFQRSPDRGRIRLCRRS